MSANSISLLSQPVVFLQKAVANHHFPALLLFLCLCSNECYHCGSLGLIVTQKELVQCQDVPMTSLGTSPLFFTPSSAGDLKASAFPGSLSRVDWTTGWIPWLLNEAVSLSTRSKFGVLFGDLYQPIYFYGFSEGRWYTWAPLQHLGCYKASGTDGRDKTPTSCFHNCSSVAQTCGAASKGLILGSLKLWVMSTCVANQADKCCQLKPVLCSSAFHKWSVFVSPRGQKAGWVGNAPRASEWALV